MFGKYNNINRSGYSTYGEWIKTTHQSRNCSIRVYIKVGETHNDFTLTVKEQTLRVTLQSNNDDGEKQPSACR
jgi:hypothetical protein